MTTQAILQLTYLLDEAFEGTEWHSLLGNLHSVTPEDWLWVPPGVQPWDMVDKLISLCKRISVPVFPHAMVVIHRMDPADLSV